MVDAERSYLPALGKHWLLPLYDPLLWLLGADKPKRQLIEQASLRPGMRVLDVGCGTGSLAVLIKKSHPDAEVVGLEPDPAAIATANRKAKRAMLPIEFERGFSDRMPYPDSSFDRVFSSFMIHHLKPDERSATLREIRRVLKPRGSVHVLDFAPHDSAPHGAGGHRFHLAPHAHERFEGHMTALMSAAGFDEAIEVARGKIIFGAIAYYRARAPA
jgi:ubiquinone/menaquinone biosynthesis C-methylase UbiE